MSHEQHVFSHVVSAVVKSVVKSNFSARPPVIAGFAIVTDTFLHFIEHCFRYPHGACQGGQPRQSELPVNELARAFIVTGSKPESSLKVREATPTPS